MYSLRHPKKEMDNNRRFSLAAIFKGLLELMEASGTLNRSDFSNNYVTLRTVTEGTLFCVFLLSLADTKLQGMLDKLDFFW
jgi:hypothetical protein